MHSRVLVRTVLITCFVGLFSGLAFADTGEFDMARWTGLMESVRSRAAAQNISESVIDDTLRSPAFIPSIVKSDKNQSEFKLTLNEYLNKTVNSTRIAKGRKMRNTYPTLLSRVDKAYGLPPHVILAFWGMESNYGEIKSRHRLVDAFFTLMYDGRREKFFGDQLLALMNIADKNSLDINKIRGSWAGAMGHFQFIPTTLSSYGVDGDGDKRVDIINDLPDAMFSAGYYLNQLGWNKNERIAQRVYLPPCFDKSLADGKTKKTLNEWAAMGIRDDSLKPLGGDMAVGLVADAAALSDCDYPDDAYAEAEPFAVAYLTYPNFYRIKKWTNSNWYAIAIAELADKLK